MVATLETIFLHRPVPPWLALTVRLTATLARLRTFPPVLPTSRQPAAVWRVHALRGLQNPRLMYCRLRAVQGATDLLVLKP